MTRQRISSRTRQTEKQTDTQRNTQSNKQTSRQTDVIWDVFGSALGDMFEVHTSFLFKKMDTNQDQEVDWDEFCTMTSTSFRPFRALFAEPHAAPNAPCNMLCCVRTLVGC